MAPLVTQRAAAAKRGLRPFSSVGTRVAAGGSLPGPPVCFNKVSGAIGPASCRSRFGETGARVVRGMSDGRRGRWNVPHRQSAPRSPPAEGPSGARTVSRQVAGSSAIPDRLHCFALPRGLRAPSFCGEGAPVDPVEHVAELRRPSRLRRPAVGGDGPTQKLRRSRRAFLDPAGVRNGRAGMEFPISSFRLAWAIAKAAWATTGNDHAGGRPRLQAGYPSSVGTLRLQQLCRRDLLGDRR